MSNFVFSLGQEVTIKASGEKGVIRARAEYLHSCDCYYIHYKAADGRAVSSWFDVDLIEAKD